MNYAIDCTKHGCDYGWDVILDVYRVHCQQLGISWYRGDSVEISLDILTRKKKLCFIYPL